jgi:HD-GYP domain-containing protein (c-di-GMP phosphodiesterase class II)
MSIMMYSLPATPLSSTFNSRTWSAILRAVTIIGHEIEPEIYAHFQPHAFATARLARRFASYIEGIRGWRHVYEEIEFGAFMHDIGKYYIAPELLLKPGPLDNEERMIVSLHSVYGAIAISKLPGITNIIRRITLHHHEHWDGCGYPDGLSGINIPLEARIVAIVDVYISLRARRSYKPAMVKEEAFGLLKQIAGRELDPALVEDFLRMFGADNRIL